MFIIWIFDFQMRRYSYFQSKQSEIFLEKRRKITNSRKVNVRLKKRKVYRIENY